MALVKCLIHCRELTERHSLVVFLQLFEHPLFYLQIVANLVSEEAPVVTCLTDIYHPNIDTSSDSGYGDSSNVCLNMLDIHSQYFGLDGVVLGLIFLLKNPNLEDPLSPYFEGYDDIDDYSKNVEKYLKGEAVDGKLFVTNFRVVDGVTTVLPRPEHNTDNENETENKTAEGSTEAPVPEGIKNDETSLADESANIHEAPSDAHTNDSANAHEMATEILNGIIETVHEICVNKNSETAIQTDSSDSTVEHENDATVDDLENCNDGEEDEVDGLHFIGFELVTVGDESFLVHRDDKDLVVNSFEAHSDDKVDPDQGDDTVVIDIVETGEKCPEQNSSVSDTGVVITTTTTNTSVMTAASSLTDTCTHMSQENLAVTGATHRRRFYMRFQSAFFKFIYLFNCAAKAYNRVKI